MGVRSRVLRHTMCCRQGVEMKLCGPLAPSLALSLQLAVATAAPATLIAIHAWWVAVITLLHTTTHEHGSDYNTSPERRFFCNWRC